MLNPLIWPLFNEYIRKVKCCTNHLHFFCYYGASGLNIGSCVQFCGMRPPISDSAWNFGSDRCCPIFRLANGDESREETEQSNTCTSESVHTYVDKVSCPGPNVIHPQT